MPVFKVGDNVKFNFHGQKYAGTVSGFEGDAKNPEGYKVLVRQRTTINRDGNQVWTSAAQETYTLPAGQVEDNPAAAYAGFA